MILFQVLGVLVLMWHSNINLIKLTHLASLPYVAWKGKRNVAWKEEVNVAPEVACQTSSSLYLGHLCRQPLGYCRSWCRGEVAGLPSFSVPFAHLPPHHIPHHYCHATSSHRRTAPTVACHTSGFGAQPSWCETWELLDVVTQGLQPARGTPCSNIFLEWSRVYRLIRNTRLLGNLQNRRFWGFFGLFYFLKSVCFTS